MIGPPLGYSLASYLRSSKTLMRWVQPVAAWYANAAGYRRVGLRYDDLLIEERPDMQKAIARLNPKESYDRVYRLRRASQQSILHKDLPRDQWITAEEDTRYLTPLVEEVHAENEERLKWDTMQVRKDRH